MLTYFLVFTAIGAALSRLPSKNLAFGYILFISFFWGVNSEIVWGLAALGELSLGYFIGLYFFEHNQERKHVDDRFAGVPRSQQGIDSSNEDLRANKIGDNLSNAESYKVFQNRVLSIIRSEFDYHPDIDGFQHRDFGNSTLNSYHMGLNFYDAAIAFILLQLKNLTRPLSPNVHEFYISKLSACHRLASKSKGGKYLIEFFVADNSRDFIEAIASRTELFFVADILKGEFDCVESAPLSALAPPPPPPPPHLKSDSPADISYKAVVKQGLSENHRQSPAGQFDCVRAGFEDYQGAARQEPDKEGNLLRVAILLSIVLSVIFFAYISESSKVSPEASAPVINGVIQSREFDGGGSKSLADNSGEGEDILLEAKTGGEALSGEGFYAIAQSQIRRANNIKDFQLAQQNLELALTLDVPLAGYELGFLHENELIDNSSMDLALEYYKIAADAMSSNAAYRLGVIYSRAESGSDNHGKAVYYFGLAKNLGHEDAAKRLEILTR